MTQSSTFSSLEARTLTGSPITVSEPALLALRAAFRGPMLRSGDTAYDETRKIWNGMIDRRPALILQCTGAADVLQAVRFAREHGLLFSVRGGGHNIAGLAACEGGILIDLSPLKGVWVDPGRRTARAQAGCTLGDVDRETQLYGLAAVLGFVSTTGIGGLTVGGGFGYLTRRQGWTCDNLVSMDVVTAEGKSVQASAEHDSDLFWALRGGGGNFGIVTSFEYSLYPVGPQVMAGAIAWKGEDAPEVLRFYREITASAPRELACVAGLRMAPPAPWLPQEIHGKPMIALFVCHTGRPEDGAKLVAPIKAFGKPVADIIVPRPYVQMQSLIDATQPKGRRYYWKSEYLPGLESNAIDTLVEHAARIRSPHSAILLFQLDGALNQLPADHSPAGNRTAKYVLNIAGSWESAPEDAVNIGWARECWQAIRGFSTGGVYVNFLTEEEGNERIAAAYTAPILQRLSVLKQKYDPENLFRHNKNIPPANGA
jgi:FAD/FMN-containing dehydrogenase